jgi:hypothetical protein
MEVRDKINAIINESIEEWDHQARLYGNKGPAKKMSTGAILALSHIRGEIRKVFRDAER